MKKCVCLRSVACWVMLLMLFVCMAPQYTLAATWDDFGGAAGIGHMSATATVKASGYASPSKRAKVSYTIPKGKTVTVDGAVQNGEGLFIYVLYKGIGSFVPAAQLKPVGSAASSAPTSPKLAAVKNSSKFGKLSTAEFNKAVAAASQIAQQYVGLGDDYAKAQAVYNYLVQYRNGLTYSTSIKHYNDAYGFFVSKVASCAGCTRGTGLLMSLLGIQWEHINPNQWTHQWVRAKINGQYIIVDAYGLYFGPEPAPKKHPLLQ